LYLDIDGDAMCEEEPRGVHVTLADRDVDGRLPLVVLGVLLRPSLQQQLHAFHFRSAQLPVPQMSIIIINNSIWPILIQWTWDMIIR